MRLALTQALQGYEGALVVVSHDRHLLRSTCDELWLVSNGEVAPFSGDLEDYRNWLDADKSERKSRAAQPAGVDFAADAGSASDAVSRKDKRRVDAAVRAQAFARRKPLAAKLAKAEQEIEALTGEKAGLDAVLASPEIYGDAQRERLQAAIAQQNEITWKLAACEQRWLALQEELDALGTEVK
jgi:ATP-binding cassette subfamily F protein 3